MPIEYAWDGEESVSVTYIDESGVRHELDELLGAFTDELDAELSAIDHASDLMTAEERRALQAKAYKRDEMRQRGRQRWLGVSKEARTEHAKMAASKDRPNRRKNAK